MPRRSTPNIAKGAFAPPTDTATFRDLLMFEERLKTNAMMLKKRKSRYQFFLAQLILAIAFLSSEVFLQASFLSIPYQWALQRVFPDIYTDDITVQLHPYFTLGLLFVAVTTLFLFFASGMYGEKIEYANRYVPSANRALRSFNMHLNVRAPPLQSKLPFNPFRILFARPSPDHMSVGSGRATPPPTPPTPPTPSGTIILSLPPSRSPRASSPTSNKRPRSVSVGPVPIPSIPPTTNPRGELIFSSKVIPSFRDGYERYRAAFERRREEKERLKRWEARWRWAPWNWFMQPPPPLTAVPGSAGGIPGSRGHSPSSSLSTSVAGSISGGSSRGRSSRNGSPGPSSGRSRRSASPMAQAEGAGGGSGGRSGTPPTIHGRSRLSGGGSLSSGAQPPYSLSADSDRSRTDSFNYIMETTETQ